MLSITYKKFLIALKHFEIGNTVLNKIFGSSVSQLISKMSSV